MLPNEDKETVEAKLAGFIDDHLDAEGRAEIVKHLEEHPEHRRLLNELRAGRDFLRGLPRESAPPDLMESFGGQLERAALLEGVTQDSGGPRLRIGPWPQAFAAAAIITLTVGLGAVVYFALPAFQHKPEVTFAKLPDASHTPVAISARDGAKEKKAKLAAEGPSDALLDKPSAPLASATPAATSEDEKQQFAKAAEPSGKGAGEELAMKKPGPPASDHDLALAPANDAPPAGRALSKDAVVIVVTSDDAARANKSVADVLKSNGIRWEPASDRVADGLLGNRLEAEQAPGIPPAPVAAPSHERDHPDRAAKDAADPGAGAGEPGSSPANGAEHGAGADESVDQFNKARAAAPPAAPVAARSLPAPEGLAVSSTQPAQKPAAAQVAQASDAPKSGGQLQSQAQESIASVTNNFYVCRNLSRKQAGDLERALSNPQAGLKAQLLPQQGDNAQPNAQQFGLAPALPQQSPADASRREVLRADSQVQAKGAMKLGRAGADEAAAPATEPVAPAAPAVAAGPVPAAMDKAEKGSDARVPAAASKMLEPDLVIQKGDSLRLTFRKNSAPATAPATVQVQPDGNVPLPNAGSVPAAGQSVPEVERSINRAYQNQAQNQNVYDDIKVERYREFAESAKLRDAKTLSGNSGYSGNAATQPAELMKREESPSAEVAALPAETPLDVVIVVQKNAPESAATQPSLQK